MHGEVVAVILGMALVTYGARAGGMWLMGRVTPSPRLDAWLQEIPGAILISLTIPAALASGLAGALALLVTVVVAARGGNLLLALVAGVVAIVFFRWVI